MEIPDIRYYSRTWLEGDTVVSIVDDGILKDDIVTAVDIPSICVRCSVWGGRYGVECDVIEDDVRSFVDEIEPFWTIDHFDILDGDIVCLKDGERDGT